MRKIVMGMMLGMIAGQVSAANWVTVGSDAEADIQIDTESPVNTVGKFKTIWVKQVYKSPSSNHGASYGIGLFYYDCAARVQAIKSSFFYNGAGKLIGSGSEEIGQLKFNDVVPDSHNATLAKLACKRG